MGRAKHEFTEQQLIEIRRLAEIGLRDDHIARFYEISEPTLKKYAARELSEGRHKGHSTLLTLAYDRARKSDAILIFLLKTRLGMKESGPDDTNNQPLEVNFSVTRRGERIAQEASGDE